MYMASGQPILDGPSTHSGRPFRGMYLRCTIRRLFVCSNWDLCVPRCLFNSLGVVSTPSNNTGPGITMCNSLRRYARRCMHVHSFLQSHMYSRSSILINAPRWVADRVITNSSLFAWFCGFCRVCEAQPDVGTLELIHHTRAHYVHVWLYMYMSI